MKFSSKMLKIFGLFNSADGVVGNGSVSDDACD